jgi:hypothetical protein
VHFPPVFEGFWRPLAALEAAVEVPSVFSLPTTVANRAQQRASDGVVPGDLDECRKPGGVRAP